MSDVNEKSMAKVAAYAEFAQAAGWESAITVDGDVITCTTTRGSESMSLRWKGSGFELNTATYTYGSTTTPIRNPSMARQKMSVSVADAGKASAPGIPRTRGRKVTVDVDDDAYVARAKAALPFDPSPDGTMDEDVFKALGGKTLTWRNHRTKELERATVAINPGQALMKMDVKGDRRVFTFVSVKGPFRSIYLDAILEVK